MEHVGWLGVIVAALAGFLLGALWYNQKVFGAAWMRGLGLSEEQLAGGSIARIMSLAFVAYLIMAFVLELFLQGSSNVRYGTAFGFHIGFGSVAAMLAVFYLFERRPLKIFLINAGYAIVTLTIMGALVAWL